METKKPKPIKLIIEIVLILFLLLKLLSQSAKISELENENKKLKSLNQPVEELVKKIGALEEENKALKQNENLQTQNEANQTDQEEVKENNNYLSINDQWTVDGQWKLKILSVKTTEERNEFSDKKPKQVVVVSYAYENIGYEDDILDGLYLSPDQVIDASGSVGYKYPGNRTHYADEIPVGAKVEIAEEVFGLDNESKEILINFSLYDDNRNKQKVTFKVPVN